MTNYNGNYSNKIFYTMTLNNNTDSSIPLAFQQELTQFMLPEPCSDWECSIIRYSVPLTAIPISYLLPNQEKVTLSYGINKATISLDYNDANRNPNNTYDPNDTKRPIYQLSQYQQIINAAIHKAFVALNAIVALPTINEPYVIYEKESQRWSFYADSQYYADTVVGKITLSLNRKLFNSVIGIDAIATAIYNMEFDVLFHNNLNNIDPITFYIKNEQQNDSFALLTDFSSIIVTTNLPVQSEYIKGGIRYNVMTDFIALDPTAGRFYTPLVYTAVVPYRQAQILSDSQINSIILRLYYTTSYDDIVELRMAPGTHAELKLMFQRKSEAKY